MTLTSLNKWKNNELVSATTQLKMLVADGVQLVNDTHDFKE